DEEGHFELDEVIARFRGENTAVRRDKIDYMDVSLKQVVSGGTACVPFLENDESNRAFMDANMQRQEVPLLELQASTVGIGMEYVTGKDSGAAIICQHDGVVEKVEAKEITVRRVSSVGGEQVSGDLDTYSLQKYIRSNQGTCYNQRPIIKE